MSGQTEEKMHLHDFIDFLKNRVRSQTMEADYIERECENLDFTYSDDDFYDYKKVIKELTEHYDLTPLIIKPSQP